ncbi:MAG: response regulator transcription factor [Oscillospiraceae bacterium]|nr:response regulator transcription factor [Eubacteriales bacterium]MDY2618110.1 response regulator transcription factor [Oscillospiraceae bacterium]
MADRILIVEDEEKLNRMIELELKYEGYETGKALDGRTGLDMALSGGYDLVLLDIMLPGLNGLEVLRRIRKENERLPVILLTARDTTMDKVSGLDSGADDYVTKPFAIEELLARIRTALRKHAKAAAAPAEENAYTVQDVRLEKDARRVLVNGAEVKLTRKEFDLLECLMEHRGKVMDRSSLLEQVWGYDFAGETNSVDVVVRFLRSKIDEPYGLTLIETVRGVGYVIR